MLTRVRPPAAGEALGVAWLADLSLAVPIALSCLTFALSYAALLFAGTPPEVQGRGLLVMLTTCAVLMPAGALLSSRRFFVLFSDGSLVALLAAATSATVAELAGSPDGEVVATLLATVALASIATGAMLWLVGALRGGVAVRFVPYQVVAGILAASGWSLATGGLGVALGHPFAWVSLATGANLVPLLLTLAAAILFQLAGQLLRHPVSLPATLIGLVALHHAVTAALGLPLDAQHRDGLLMASLPSLSLHVTLPLEVLGAVDWPVLEHHAFDLLALFPVAVVALLLNLTGIEAATGLDLDVNRDLRANGIANILCGLMGGAPGITSMSRSAQLYAGGMGSPLTPVAAGLGAALLPLVWPGLIGLVPRYVLGGLLLSAGYGLLVQWMWSSRRRLTTAEWLTVLAVLAVAVNFGLVAGTLSGLLLGCIAFAVIYSRNSPVRARYRGDVARSRVERSDVEEKRLARDGGALLVMHLQGFIFFGTANRLVGDIRQELDREPGRLRFLVLEFGDVHGIDGSALAGFERLGRMAKAGGFALVFAAMARDVAARLLPPPGAPPAAIVATLDEALERCEEALLSGLGPHPSPSFSDVLASALGGPGALRPLLDALRAEDVPAGAVMMRQGELSDDLLFIETGQASVSVRFGDGEPVRVRSFGSGAMVGEIGFCLGLPRTATVRADRPCRVHRLTRPAMERLQAEHPAAALAFQRMIIQRLGGRLLDKDQLIGALMLNQTGR